MSSLLGDLRGYRKTFIAALALGLACGLAAFGKLTGEFVQVAITALMAFNAANAVEHIKRPS